MVLEQIKDIILMKESFGSVKVQSQHGLIEHDSGKASVIILYSRNTFAELVHARSWNFPWASVEFGCDCCVELNEVRRQELGSGGGQCLSGTCHRSL